MEAAISEQHLKTFVHTLQCLGKIGRELYIEADHEKVLLVVWCDDVLRRGSEWEMRACLYDADDAAQLERRQVRVRGVLLVQEQCVALLLVPRLLLL
jgi:hypothetical protein